MRFWINNTKHNTPDVILTLVFLTVMAAVVRFVLDGVTVNIGTNSFTFGHVDSMSYATLLAPILGAHGYLESKQTKKVVKDENN